MLQRHGLVQDGGDEGVNAVDAELLHSHIIACVKALKVCLYCAWDHVGMCLQTGFASVLVFLGWCFNQRPRICDVVCGLEAVAARVSRGYA